MSAIPPDVAANTYNRSQYGYCGELGSGNHARIRFLQCAIPSSQLDNITLIENIPGSERWNIRDLFQRDVDMTRVEQSIFPYLEDKSKVKFFNPLTLVLLPIHENESVDADVPYIPEEQISKNNISYIRYERKGCFKFDVHGTEPAFSELHWNDSRVKVVAIDGQHRLSALKYWKTIPGPKDLDTWQIPVIILGVFRADNIKEHRPASLLEIVRKTFIYINTRAEEVNESRRILLDDEEIQAVCTQELVQASHQNDCLPDRKKNLEKLPLLFFDWRGQVKWRKEQQSSLEERAPGAILSIQEIYEWFRNYIIGDDLDTVKTVLGLDDLYPPLSEIFLDSGRLTSEDADRVRVCFEKLIYPGVSSLLENFQPYKNYAGKIRALEVSTVKDTPLAVHVFQRLRFGSHPELLGGMKELVDQQYKNVLEKISNIRIDCFDELINRDIGMRAVIYSFGALKDTRDDFSKATGDWLEHAEWFTVAINKIYAAGWFRGYHELTSEMKKTLTHICYGPDGSIINYKISDAQNALGALISLLVAKENLEEFTDAQRAELWDSYGESLSSPLRKGFRKEQRAILKDAFQGTVAEFNAKVNEAADKDVKTRLKFIRNKVVGFAEG